MKLAYTKNNQSVSVCVCVCVSVRACVSVLGVREFICSYNWESRDLLNFRISLIQLFTLCPQTVSIFWLFFLCVFHPQKCSCQVVGNSKLILQAQQSQWKESFSGFYLGYITYQSLNQLITMTLPYKLQSSVDLTPHKPLRQRRSSSPSETKVLLPDRKEWLLDGLTSLYPDATHYS